MKQLSLTFIIVSFNTVDLLEKCLKTLFDSITNSVSEAEVIVVDNGSTDGTIEFIKNNYPDLVLIESIDNLGYSKAVNKGAQIAKGDFIAIVNSDIQVNSNAINLLLDYLKKHRNVGVIGPQMVFPDGKWQRSYGEVPSIVNVFSDVLLISVLRDNLKKLLWPLIKLDFYPKDVGYIDGAFMLTPREIFNQMNGFDEDFFFYAEDLDYCYRIKRNNYKVVFFPKSKIIHVKGGSSIKKLNLRYTSMLLDAKILFIKKHYNDKFLNMFLLSQYLHWTVKKCFYKLLKPLFDDGFIKNRIEICNTMINKTRAELTK